MNRNQEFLELTREIETLQAPGGSVERAMAQVRHAKRSKYVLRPLTGLAAVFAVFVMLINVSPTVAQACSKVPILRDLAQAVRFSPSMNEAVENNYYQPIGLEQTHGYTTVRVEYLIVDQKNVNVFYRVLSAPKIEPEDPDDPVEHSFLLSPEIRKPEGADWEYCISTRWCETVGPGAMQYASVQFGNTDVPSELDFQLSLVEPEEPDRNLPEVEPFVFHLKFDPSFTAQGEHFETDQAFALDGQKFRLTGISVYPTYLEFTLESEADNTAWLTGLDYELVTEDGTRYARPDGISAVGNPDTPEFNTFRVDSPFFFLPTSATLCITEAEWKLKAQPKTHVDLKTGTAENEVISTLSIATSSLVTILVLAVGVLLLTPLQPVLQSPVLRPAFDQVVPALFGALAYRYYRKDVTLALIPLAVMSALFILLPSLASSTSILIIPSGAIAIGLSYLKFRKTQQEARV